MLKIYTESKLIRTSNCDFNGKWRISDILALLQEGAGTHAHLLGCGREPMLRENIVWVLSRTELKMERYPTVGETIRMETFPMANRRWFFPRYFWLYDEENKVIGRAGTLWLLMDYVQRKMAAPEAALKYMPDNTDLTAPLDFPGNIAPVGGVPAFSARMPMHTDIDVNQHVNNTRYADWLCDALGMDVMKEKEISHLLIHYTREILPHQEIRLALERQGDALRLTGSHGEEKHFDLGASLRGQELRP